MSYDNNLSDNETNVKSEEFKQCDNCKTTKRKLYRVKDFENGHIDNLCYDCRFNRFFGRTLQEILDDSDGFIVAQELFQLVRNGTYLAPYSQIANYIYFAFISGQIKDGSILKAIFEDKKNISQFSERRDEIVNNLKRAHIIDREDQEKFYFTQKFLELLYKYQDKSDELFSRILGLCLVNIISYSKYDSTMKQIWLRSLTSNKIINRNTGEADEERLVQEVEKYRCLECNRLIETKEQAIEHLKVDEHIDLPREDQYDRHLEPIFEAIGYKLYVSELEKTIQRRMSPSAFMKFFSDGINANFYFYSKKGEKLIKEDEDGRRYFIVKAPWIRVMCKTLEKMKELELTKGITS